MKKQFVPASLCLLFCLIASGPRTSACTNILVTKGASADGSVMITYTCDGEFHPRLRRMPAADHEPGSWLEITDWSGKVRGKIRQTEHTYAVVGLINEHQLAIAETTFSGREELHNPEGLLHYWDLMRIALQRAKTAREAIGVITSLVEEYGYRSTGESISIADKNEAWILEIIGPGPRGTSRSNPESRGAHWVALRVPDGMVSCHANKARIGTFPLDDPENCLYSIDVISFAVEKGFWKEASGEPFRFCEAYCPSTPKNCRYADGRVWSILRRTAPSLELSADRHRDAEGAGPYPLWIEPDKKLTLSDLMGLMRDHFEGTDFDMTKGVDAGPYGTPNRWRPMYWTIDGEEHAWERPVSTQQTGFTFVSQSRSWLPDPVGGVYWYGLDDTYFSCYVPLYCCIDALPESYTRGSLDSFSWDSAWWVFNFVANYANLRYSDMRSDIQAVQNEIEGNFIALQPAVEKTALALVMTDRALMTRYLTDYSVTHAELTVRRWRELGEHLIRKYNDGYIQEQPGRARERGYPENWLRKVLESRPARFRLPKKADAIPESELIDS
jgi:dipeptidase